MKKRIDPELEKQLEPKTKRAAEANGVEDDDNDMVEAVIKVQSAEGTKEEDVEELLETVIARLEKSENQTPDDYNIFPLMQRAVIRGKRSYMSKLIDQPEVVAAMANKRSKDDI